MKKFVTILAAVMLAILAVVPMGFASAEGNRMYVAASNGGCVRLRSLPTLDGKIETTFNVGRPVEVMDNYGDGEWSEVRVQVNGRYVYGYMMNKFLSANDPATRKQTFEDVAENVYVKVLPERANGIVSLWNRPSKHSSDKIRNLDRNETMLVVSESNAWYMVSAADGELGYVAKAYVTK